MEDKEGSNQEDHKHPSVLHNNQNGIATQQKSQRKPIGDHRVKRDEWSEGAVCTLLEAYEAKWVLRNRAKLKGHDWEDVAREVSSRENSTKSAKTQTQCQNKIESMKKRYRSESATTTADASPSWPLYSRLHLLLLGTGPPLSTHSQQPPPLPSPPPPQNSHGSNGVHKLPKEDGLPSKSSDHVLNKNPSDTDSSTPAVYSEKGKSRSNKRKIKLESNRLTKKEDTEIAESLRWLAQVVARSEQARIDTMKEIERMRVEAEAKRGEMELKTTEIIANTQLKIARIFASVNKGVDSPLRIGRI